MSNNKMLIDATHPEETRVVVLRGGRVEEFDYESAARKLLRGNIYLAKVTRVEPSLQAAFVDYGGNRHGFLAFNEIHPDYYQIPMADRQALIEEEAQAEAEEEAAADARAEARARRAAQRQQQPHGQRRNNDEGDGSRARSEDDEQRDDDRADDDRRDDDERDDDAGDDRNDEAGNSDGARVEDVGGDEAPAIRAAEGVIDEILSEPVQPETVGGFDPEGDQDDAGDDEQTDEGAATEQGETGAHAAAAPAASNGDAAAESIDEVGSEDALEETRHRPRRRMRSYKIQEVIKRRQVILVQVVKEERGNKGAALTTYLSLAGRYTVLMPNTARGGGISRKITQPQDRKRLKAIAQELEVPEGMGLIIRTAGAARTKQEIKRDFEYLLRLWESVRDMTLQSVAPSLVYEEGNLIKRSIRDLYTKEIEEIVVAGDVAHADARDFMRMLMPSHTKNVIEYREPEPLFTRYGIERQLNAMFSPYVTLRSGGYLVINQTEALVAIDINSGKSTREFSIEETALNTNLEAADEIARQLKLRDLAGLIVIDFIDMEERRNNRKVESRIKDALRFDRARIQVGRISHFGLLEMSRQRLRTGVLEGSTSQCPHCQGTGIIRSTESVALAVLRGLEDALMAGARTSLIANTTTTVALYILNKKRQFINDMEARHGISITIQSSDKLQGANFTIEKGATPAAALRRPERAAVNMDWGFEGEEAEGAVEPDTPDMDDDADNERGGERTSESRGERSRDRDRGGDRDRDDFGGRDGEGGRRRRRRRRRGGGRDDRGEHRNGNGQHQHTRGGRDDDSDDDGRSGPIEIDTDDTVEEIGEGSGIEDIGGGDRAEGGERTARDEQGGDDQRQRRGRRRGRRGGRRGRGNERGERNGEGMTARGDDADSGDNVGDETEADAPHSVSHPGAEQPSIEFDAAPKRTPRHRDAEPGAEREPVVAREREAETPSPARVEEPRTEAEAQPAPRRRHEPTSSEPKIERVVVKADPSADTPAPEAAPQPARKGWWSRRLGGE